MQWLTSGEWGYPFCNNPKMAMGQSSSNSKKKDLDMKAMISFSETWYCFPFRVNRRSEVMVNKGFSARNECSELKRPKFQFTSTFNETTA